MADHIQAVILVINPNSNVGMTESLRPVLQSLGFDAAGIKYELFTAPSGPHSINDEKDAEESVRHCLPEIEKAADRYAGFLVGCYSAHPLVAVLRSNYPSKHTIGIFEASVTAALNICGLSCANDSPCLPSPSGTWGIVTTGKVWERLLTDAVNVFLGLDHHDGKSGGQSGRFAGVQSTGLNASELHDAPKHEVRKRLTEATQRLLATGDDRERLKVVVLGCAGMAELEEVVREVVPREVKVVDGVKAGFCALVSTIVCRI